MKKILITGTSGMLGAALVSLWSPKFRIFATSSSNFSGNPARNFKEFNLKSKNFESLAKWVNPDVIVHCAAITSHEYCQSNPKAAMLVNGESVIKLINAFPGVKIILISSDAVYPLNMHLATEKTKIRPTTVYGKSKELAETYILNSSENGCVVRTTIVGKNINPGKQSFAEWIVNSVKAGKKISLYKNILFTPITIWNFAKELEWVINHDTPTVMNIAGSEIVSKYRFGFILCQSLNLNLNMITEGKLNQKNELIKRSEDQTLDCKYFQSVSGHNLPDFKETIKLLVKHFK